jgi:hypothetical protein
MIWGMVAGLATLTGVISAFSFLRPRVAALKRSMGPTEFFGSQVGGPSVINYSYTDLPWKLLAWDVYYFFRFAWALPWILLPMTPTDSGSLDELSINRKNLWCIFIHFVLCILQLIFLLCLPIAILFPIWMVAIAVGGFLTVNYFLCMLLNGRTMTFTSDESYAAALPEHAHEQWIFLNGVAVG